MFKKVFITSSILGLALLLIFLGVNFFSKNDTNQDTDKTTGVTNLEVESKQPLTKFYCRGSFFSNPPLLIDQYEVGIFIETVNNVLENLESPDYIDPKVYLRLVDSKKQYSDYYCQNLVIEKNHVILNQIATPLGVFNFEGSFVDKQGQPWDKMNAVNYETILKGTLKLEKNDEILYSEIVEITYWDGSGC